MVLSNIDGGVASGSSSVPNQVQVHVPKYNQYVLLKSVRSTKLGNEGNAPQEVIQGTV